MNGYEWVFPVMLLAVPALITAALGVLRCLGGRRGSR